TLLALINDILDFSKIEAGRMDIEVVGMNLHDVLEEVGELMTTRAHEKKLELLVQVDPRVPSVVRGDPTRLRQVLVNIVGNAIKFTERGEVLLRVTVEELKYLKATIRFEIKDSGIGISPDGLKRLFQSFSQVDASTTRKFGGTGLGLAISKRLIEKMGGTIEVGSDPGKGSTFRFVLPLPLPTTKTANAAEADLKGVRVLAVDDHPVNRLILKETLKPWGCAFTEA